MELIRYDSLVYQADMIIDYPLEYYSNQGVVRKKDMPRLTNLDQIFENCRVFVKTDFLSQVVQLLDQLTKPIHLVTGNSDITPDKDLVNIILNNRYVKSWVSNHIEKSDERILQIPAGFQEFGSNRNSWSVFPDPSKKDIKYLITPLGDTNSDRKDLDNIVLDGLVRLSNRLSYQDYIEYIGRSSFTLCPAGNAVDSHRVCESIIMLSTPIVKRGILDPMYTEMGCLVVNDWSNIKPVKKKLDKNKVSLDYWKNRITEHQNKFKD